MQFYEALEQYGYELAVKPGAVPIVEAKRTPAATINARAAAPLLLELSRHQDEAIAYLRNRNAPQQIVTSPLIEAWTVPQPASADVLAKQILSGLLSPRDEAIAICRYCIALGDVATSDGLLWVEVLRDLMETK